MKSKKAWIAGGIILIALIVIVKIFSGGQEVQVVKAERGDLTLSVEEVGYVQSVGEYDVEASQAGQVEEILVASGDTVKAGDPLVYLSSPRLTAEVSSAESELAWAETELASAQLSLNSLQSELNQGQKDLERKMTLLKEGAVAQADYDKAAVQVEKLGTALSQQKATVNGLEQQVASLRQTLSSLKVNLKDLEVLSPQSGTVLDLPVKVGQVVSPGSMLVQIGPKENLEIKTELLSDEVGKVKVGQKSIITAPILEGKVINGRVSKIYPRAYEKISALGVVQRRVPVIIEIDEAVDLQPGYEVRVEIETVQRDKVVLIPREAVRLDENGNYQVMAVVNKRVQYRLIEVGEKNQQWAEVRQGIKVGDTIIRDGSMEITENSRVKPVSK